MQSSEHITRLVRTRKVAIDLGICDVDGAQSVDFRVIVFCAHRKSPKIISNPMVEKGRWVLGNTTVAWCCISRAIFVFEPKTCESKRTRRFRVLIISWRRVNSRSYFLELASVWFSDVLESFEKLDVYITVRIRHPRPGNAVIIRIALSNLRVNGASVYYVDWYIVLVHIFDECLVVG